MGISLKQAICFVPKDKHWLRQVFIGGLLLFFPAIIYIFPGVKRLLFNPLNYYCIAIFGILALTIFLAVCGYFFKTVHNRIVHSEECLPSWKYFGYYTFIGLKAYIGGFLFSLPFLCLTALIYANSPLNISVEIIPFAVAALIIHVIYTAAYVMMGLNFSLDFQITSFFNIKKAIYFIQGNVLNYIIVIAYCLLLALVNLVLDAILMSGHILALLVPFISFYVCLIYTDLFAQLAMNKKGLQYHEEKCCI